MAKQKKTSILIVDVEVDLLSSLKEILDLNDFEVTTLEDLRKIFDLCNTRNFDAVLSHWIDPYLKVEEVFDQLRLQHPQTRFIIMTGSINISETIENKYPFLYKPFQIEELENLLRTPLL